MSFARLVPRRLRAALDRLRPLVDRLSRVERRLRLAERRLRLAEAFFLLAVLGWALSSDTLALLGCIGALGVVALVGWQRHCLDGVAYRRRLSCRRARFGEQVALEIEIVNDKPLPLSFLEIEDEIPSGVPIGGGSLSAASLSPGRQRRLVQVLPLLPYQRVRRRLVVDCDRRGDHRFGPATLTSGDPVGWRTRTVQAVGTDHLLVYPKLLQLVPEGMVSRVLVGEHRTRARLPGDPSRVAGVRPYEPGDPLRHVDWRATARVGELAVRRFEPTVSPKVAVLLDVFVPSLSAISPELDELELAVSVAASLVREVADRRIPVGLYTTGTAAGRPVAHPPSGAPAALGAMLESLARVIAFGSLSFERVLLSATARMASETSVVVVAADFPPRALAAVAEARRRHAVSALFLAGAGGRPPPAGSFDAVLATAYVEDWKSRSSLKIDLVR